MILCKPADLREDLRSAPGNTYRILLQSNSITDVLKASEGLNGTACQREVMQHPTVKMCKMHRQY